MKTAISIPDHVYEQVERDVRELGINRSEFFTQAARHYHAHLREQSTTAELNAALELAADDDSNAVAASTGRRFLAASDDDEW